MKNILKLHALIFEKMTKWWLQIPLIYRLTGRSKKQLYHLKLIDEMTSDIISKRKRALNGTDNGFSDAVLDRFILSGDLTEGELRSATHTLFMTSQDVVAKIASAVLVFLAHLPDWQERVYNEILQVLGPQDDNVTEEDWKKLTNLDMVFKEVLRYMTIGPLIQRTVEKEVTIKNGTLTIPVGASVVIPIHFVHRDSQNWEEPNKVNPGRFHPDCLTTWDPDSFIPFSLGAMDCIGRLYGISLVKTLVIRVLRRVKFEADGAIEDLELNIAITVVFAKGYNLRASKRETNDVKPSSKTIGIKK